MRFFIQFLLLSLDRKVHHNKNRSFFVYTDNVIRLEVAKRSAAVNGEPSFDKG